MTPEERRLLALVEQLEAKVLAVRAGLYDVAEEAWCDAKGMFAPLSDAEFAQTQLGVELASGGVRLELQTRSELLSRVAGLEAKAKIDARAMVRFIDMYNGLQPSPVPEPSERKPDEEGLEKP